MKELMRCLIGLPVLVLLVLSAGGCSSNPYRPFNGELGYSDAPISGDQFEVSYTGDSDVSPTQARYFATVRAAQVAQGHGKEYFEILNSKWGERTDTVYEPGSTFVNGGGRRRGGITTITQTPGYVRSYASPTSVLTIRVVDSKTTNSLDARQVLEEATGKGVLKLSARDER
jgi:hypothetical protein